MGIHPTKPRYTCANCKYGDKPRDIPCTVCPVTDKPTQKPRQWAPKVDFSKWEPTAMELWDVGNSATSLPRGSGAIETRISNKVGQELICKVKTPRSARRKRLF